jgi:uncharacterized membrane protein YphA (DoxX/SURF4 family)
VSPKALVLAPWRSYSIAFLRVLFGVVWAIDAWFKFQPDFINNFTSYLTGSLDGQPGWVQSWIHFWINVIKVDPHVFAHIVAFGEAAIAVALIFGAFTNLTVVGGILLSMVIWTTAEGFGGPYVPGSTDIGAAIMYPLVFVGLFLAMAGMIFGLDRYLTPKLGRWGWLASGGATAPGALADEACRR